jgi:hypothetical protein
MRIDIPNNIHRIQRNKEWSVEYDLSTHSNICMADTDIRDFTTEMLEFLSTLSP